jgi:hypothetical protein
MISNLGFQEWLSGSLVIYELFNQALLGGQVMECSCLGLFVWNPG